MQRRLAVANGPNIFQMLLVRLAVVVSLTRWYHIQTAAQIGLIFF